MVMYKGPERRRCARTTKISAINIIQCNDKPTLPKLDEEVCLNIAQGGMLVECSKRLLKGTRIKIKIMLALESGFKIIYASAKIVWTKRSFHGTYYLGCKFVRLKSQDKAALKKLF